jgi:hypothetical protein
MATIFFGISEFVLNVSYLPTVLRATATITLSIQVTEVVFGVGRLDQTANLFLPSKATTKRHYQLQLLPHKGMDSSSVYAREQDLTSNSRSAVVKRLFCSDERLRLGKSYGRPLPFLATKGRVVNSLRLPRTKASLNETMQHTIARRSMVATIRRNADLGRFQS